MLSPSVRQLDFSPASPFTFQAGQWINVYWRAGEEPLKRAYSIANAPREDGCVQLAVTHVAEGTLSPQLHGLAVGSELSIDGPHGFFVRDADARRRPALFVGAGTGLSPLRAMLQAEVGRGTAPLGLLFGCRTRADVLWAGEQEGWRSHGVQVQVTLSRPEPGWHGLRGYVQEHVVDMARAMGEPDVYICGLTKMVKAVREVLKGRLGYDRRRIHSERYD